MRLNISMFINLRRPLYNAVPIYTLMGGDLSQHKWTRRNHIKCEPMIRSIHIRGIVYTTAWVGGVYAFRGGSPLRPRQDQRAPSHKGHHQEKVCTVHKAACIMAFAGPGFV